MTLKKSFINIPVLKADLKRFWWVAFLETFIFIMLRAIPIYELSKTASYYPIEERILYFGEEMPFIFVFAVCVGSLMFSYMHSSRSATTMHSYPITRPVLYCTKLMSSFILIFVPILITGAVFMFMMLDGDFSRHVIIEEILNWIYNGLTFSLFYLSLTVIVHNMCGNTVASIIFTLGFVVLPFMIYECYELLFAGEIFGISYIRSYFHGSIETNTINPDYYPLFFIGFSIIMLVAGYLLYRKRKTEANGEVIAFGWLKPVFIAIVGIFTGGISYTYFYRIVDIRHILTILPLGIIGVAIAHMVSVKKLDLKGILKPVCIYTLCALCFAGILKFDLLGIEGYIPETDEIACVKISTFKVGDNFYELTEKESIEVARNIHRNIIENKEDYPADCDSIADLEICYVLKDNTSVVRSYYMSYDELYRKCVVHLLETNESKLRNYRLFCESEDLIDEITIFFLVEDKDTIHIPGGKTKAKEMFYAMKKDIGESTYKQVQKLNINRTFSEEITLKIDYKKSDSNEYYSIYYPIPNHFTNTLKIINELNSSEKTN